MNVKENKVLLRKTDQKPLPARTLKALGSVQFAIGLIALLGLVLTVSTLFESHYGTPVAQRFFYAAGWFDVFLALFAVNILASTLTRFPYKVKHVGFIVTHIGILMLLIGSLLSRLFGVDGQMMLFEGEGRDAVQESRYEVLVHRHGGGALSFDLAKGPNASRRSLNALWPGLTLEIRRVWDNAVRVSDVVENASPDAKPNAAIRLKLESQTVGFKDSFWLIEKDPRDPNADRASIGPASFELIGVRPPVPGPRELTRTLHRGSDPNTASSIEIRIRGTEDSALLPLEPVIPSEIKIGKSGYTLKNIKYYPDARVGEKNELISKTPEPNNPAIEFDLAAPDGAITHAVFFALFPEFESMHGRKEGAKLDVHFPTTLESGPAKTSPKLVIETDGKNWSYKSFSSKGATEGPIVLGEPTRTGWMDFSFTAENLIGMADLRSSVKKLDEGKGMLAAELSLESGGRDIWSGWLMEGDAVPVPLMPPLSDLAVALRNRITPLPFHLTLKDFRKVDYPGTRSAKEFESDVILEDARDRVKIEKTISMNKPLDYKGFRIFQSSFVQDPAQGEASVFTIAKNPGIGLIYGGAIILFTGVVLLFFVKSLSSLKIFCVAGLLGLVASGMAHAGFEESRGIPIQHEGQVQSFESYAKKSVELIFEKTSFEKRPAWHVVLNALSRADEIGKIVWIRARHEELKAALGLDPKRMLFSYDEISPQMPKIVGLVQSSQAKRDKDIRPSLLEQKAESLYAKLIRVHELSSGDALRVIPPTEGEEWLTPGETQDTDAGRFMEVLLLARQGDDARFHDAARSWIRSVHEKTGGRYAQKIKLELVYHSLHPFFLAWVLYFAGFFFLAFGKNRPLLIQAGIAAACAAFLLHTSGLVLRVLILGRPPVSNMFESVVYMNWVVMLIAGLSAIGFRRREPAAVGCVVSGLIMIYSDLLPIDPSLGVLVPVLRSNYWLSIHVMTIVSSYGALGLAMGLGHRHLILWLRGKLPPKEEAISERMMLRTIQIGVLLLGVGTTLGGVWANESWGRFWGWDPKETWALITFLGYIILIHLKYKKSLTPFALAIGTILGFQLVLMTWYGVNFVLGRGLHSYGQGSGGASSIVAYLALEGIFLSFVCSRKSGMSLRGGA